jgi:hypothetical protein
MTTVTQVLQSAWRRLGQLNITKATGGSTTTAVDTKLAGKATNDQYKDGTLVVIRDAAGAGAAPEGEFNRISAYSNATTTLTVDTAFTAAVASGDTVGYTGPDFPLAMMIELLNDTLKQFGTIPYIDTTSLTIASDQTEYSLPTAYRDVKPWRIDIQSRTNDADDNQWVTLRDWEFIPAASTSSASTLYVPYGPVGHKLRLWYQTYHPTVTAYNDVISDSIDVELVILGLAVAAQEWYVTIQSGGDDYAIQKLNDLRSQFTNQMSRTPIMRPKKGVKHLPFSGQSANSEVPDPILS